VSTSSERHRFRIDVIAALDVHGFLTMPQLTIATGVQATHEAVTKRLKRMKADGLLTEHLVCTDKVGPISCWTLTNHGRSYTDGSLPGVSELRPKAVRHHLATAQVGIELHRAGYQVVTERELRFFEAERRSIRGYEERGHWPDSRRVRIWPDGRPVRYSDPNAVQKWTQAWAPKHRPDLLVRTVGTSHDEPITAANATAVEVELSKKVTRRLVEKLHWYGTPATYAKVVYLCGDAEVRRAVERAAGQAAPDLDLQVIELQREFLDAVVSGRRVPSPGVAGTLAALLGSTFVTA
jgi:hypothetical protein